MATEWQKLVKKTMMENKGMAFGDVLKLAKKEYKKGKGGKKTQKGRSRKSRSQTRKTKKSDY
jgi:hypothetical protein